jgi:hypothetical protein
MTAVGSELFRLRARARMGSTLRGLGRFSGLTQDLRPGLLSVAPAGADVFERALL